MLPERFKDLGEISSRSLERSFDICTTKDLGSLCTTLSVIIAHMNERQ